MLQILINIKIGFVGLNKLIRKIHGIYNTYICIVHVRGGLNISCNNLSPILLLNLLKENKYYITMDAEEKY